MHALQFAGADIAAAEENGKLPGLVWLQYCVP